MFSLQERFSSFELTQNTISKRKGPKAIGRFKVEVILLANQLARIVGEVFSGLGDMKRFNMRISLFSIVRKTLEDEVIRFIKTVHAFFDNS